MAPHRLRQREEDRLCLRTDADANLCLLLPPQLRSGSGSACQPTGAAPMRGRDHAEQAQRLDDLIHYDLMFPQQYIGSSMSSIACLKQPTGQCNMRSSHRQPTAHL